MEDKTSKPMGATTKERLALDLSPSWKRILLLSMLALAMVIVFGLAYFLIYS